MNDQLAAYLCVLMGVGTGTYTVYGWKKGRINFRGVSIRAENPAGFWEAIVWSGLWSIITAGVGFYWILSRIF